MEIMLAPSTLNMPVESLRPLRRRIDGLNKVGPSA